MFEQYKDVLLEVPMFKQIEETELFHILQCLAPSLKYYKKGELITMEGDDFTGIGVVIEGKVTVTKNNEVGERMIMTQLVVGEVFGEMMAFTSSKQWLATVIAESDTLILSLLPSAILSHCHRMCVGHKQLMLNMLEIISNKALGLNRKVSYLSIKSMRGKLSKYLIEEQLKHNALLFDISFNRNEMSEFLNVSRPSMSRELAKMKEEGIIDYYQTTFKIIDLEKLTDFASHLR